MRATPALAGPTPHFVIIDRALRDEGTSYHYVAPSEYGEGGAELIALAAAGDALAARRCPHWRCDAPRVQPESLPEIRGVNRAPEFAADVRRT